MNTIATEVSLPKEPTANLHDKLKDGSPGPSMVWLPGGIFRIGDDNGYEREKPAHEAAVSAHLSCRGGSWDRGAGYCRSVFRNYWFDPADRNHDLGFRLARTGA